MILLFFFFSEFAEKLFNQLDKRHDRIEVKMLTLDLISRLIGVHQLFVFNFYPYVQRYLQPRRFGEFFFPTNYFTRMFVNITILPLLSEVTKLLQFVAQATHELIPPDVSIPKTLKSFKFFYVCSLRNFKRIYSCRLWNQF